MIVYLNIYIEILLIWIYMHIYMYVYLIKKECVHTCVHISGIWAINIFIYIYICFYRSIGIVHLTFLLKLCQL